MRIRDACHFLLYRLPWLSVPILVLAACVYEPVKQATENVYNMKLTRVPTSLDKVDGVCLAAGATRAANEIIQGCSTMIGDTCFVFSPAPRDVADDDILRIAGHEIILHCALKHRHTA